MVQRLFLDTGLFPHGFTVNHDLVRIVGDPIADSVGKCRFTNLEMPALGIELGAEDR